MVISHLGEMPLLVLPATHGSGPRTCWSSQGRCLPIRLVAVVWLRTGGALVALCLISSAIYLLNDCLDVAADRVPAIWSDRMPQFVTGPVGLTMNKQGRGGCLILDETLACFT